MTNELEDLRNRAKADGGKGLGVLIGPTRSPSVVALLKEMREAFPQMVIGRYDAVRGDHSRKATIQAIGKVAEPVYELDKCRVVVSLDADFLGRSSHMIRNASRFVQSRDPVVDKMSRLYVFESGYSNTGLTSDTRVSLAPQEIIAVLAELERRVDAGASMEEAAADEKGLDEVSAKEKLDRVLSVLAAELVANKGKSLVIVGEHLGPDAIAAGIRLNNKLENLGKTLSFIEAVDGALETVDLRTFVERMSSLSSVVILASNPVFTAPVDVDLAAALGKVRETLYWGEYDDETAKECKWLVPAAHPLESWGDVVSDDGLYGVCQPQILPLLNGLSRIELLAAILGRQVSDPQAIVRETAGAIAGKRLAETAWRRLLHDGFSESLKVELLQASYVGGDGKLTEAAPKAVAADEVEAGAVDVVVVPADGLYDGRFANNGWLQEMPQSMTKVCWDNVAAMSPATARALGTKQDGLVSLRLGEDRSVTLPVYILPGAAHGVVTVSMGYGRTRAGHIGGHVDLKVPVIGVDVKALRSSDVGGWIRGVEVKALSGKTYEPGHTQDHFVMDELGVNETKDRARRLAREGTLEQLEKIPEFTEHLSEHAPPLESLWKEPMETIEQETAFPQWGMAIDLNKCIGCNACVIACQAENNVPIVGKEQVLRGREMHWLRLDRYYVGEEADPQMVAEPVACMHCETAPCEQVCPVAATVHTDDGINAMVYNRCIGTRYCGNNCPYKVRRFNYFNFQQEYGYGYGWDASYEKMENANRKLQALVLNPEVTVRGRGVMEKCTYCIQRVERGKIEARREASQNGPPKIEDGAIQTACQTACPTRAIVFGNVKDAESEVSKWHKNVRAYSMLGQLNTKPRTQYLSRIRNPHPRLMTAQQRKDLTEDHGHGAGHGDEHGHADEHGHDEPAAEKKEAAVTAGESK